MNYKISKRETSYDVLLATCSNAKRAFYLLPSISTIGMGSAEFCAQLLEQEKAAAPGIAFRADHSIRYATSMSNIEKGLKRMDRFIRSLNK